MLTYTLTEAKSRHGEVFERAIGEPVMLTRNGRESHVVMSARLFKYMLNSLSEAEDKALGARADQEKANSATVGTERFEAELRRLLNDQA